MGGCFGCASRVTPDSEGIENSVPLTEAEEAPYDTDANIDDSALPMTTTYPPWVVAPELQAPTLEESGLSPASGTPVELQAPAMEGGSQPAAPLMGSRETKKQAKNREQMKRNVTRHMLVEEHSRLYGILPGAEGSLGVRHHLNSPLSL